MMNCEELKAFLPEYWDGRLNVAERSAVESHLAACAACEVEAERLGTVWAGLGELAKQSEPGEEMRTRFYDQLAWASRRERRGPAAMPGWVPAIGIAAALVVGFLGGYFVDARRDGGQMAQLRGEVNSMRQLVALSLLQQQSASDRLQGVNWSYRVQRSDTEVLSALLYTVNHDPNVNVRLAAVDAMKTFADSPVARRGLVQAIAKQESPMVQIALIDEIVDIKESSARPALEAFAGNPAVNPEARERARWALGRLQ